MEHEFIETTKLTKLCTLCGYEITAIDAGRRLLPCKNPNFGSKKDRLKWIELPQSMTDNEGTKFGRVNQDGLGYFRHWAV
jgi:hypothetical protein